MSSLPGRFASAFLPVLIMAGGGSLAGCISGSAANTRQQLVIAHRGASGYLPEHTLAAYALAHGQGADIIEPDVALTRDGVLICVHDLTAEGVTNVAEMFPGRARPDGKWYYADLTLAEVKQLSVIGRADRRAACGSVGGLTVPTLDEMIRLIQTLNERTGRRVGIIPEPKSPRFHIDSGMPIEPVLVRALAAHGYTSLGADKGGATIQCFDLEALRRIRQEEQCALPLAWTFGEDPDPALLADAATFVQGLGPSRKLLEPPEGSLRPRTDLIAFARAHGLFVATWTLGAEPEATRRLFSRGVDAVFIDYPDVGVDARGR
ncbi:MAG: glycerophosphodiester phosphodiesterase family protein [Phycisphaerales bacterium]